MDIKELVKYTSGVFDPVDMPLTVTDQNYSYKLDTRAKYSLNKTLDTEFVAVYREEEHYNRQWKADDLSWDTEHVLLVTKRGKVICMFNSEWSHMYKESGE